MSARKGKAAKDKQWNGMGLGDGRREGRRCLEAEGRAHAAPLSLNINVLIFLKWKSLAISAPASPSLTGNKLHLRRKQIYRLIGRQTYGLLKRSVRVSASCRVASCRAHSLHSGRDMSRWDRLASCALYEPHATQHAINDVVCRLICARCEQTILAPINGSHQTGNDQDSASPP